MTATATREPRPYWIEIHGRKRRFATLADARAAANRIAATRGVIVGIQRDLTPEHVASIRAAHVLTGQWCRCGLAPAAATPAAHAAHVAAVIAAA